MSRRLATTSAALLGGLATLVSAIPIPEGYIPLEQALATRQDDAFLNCLNGVSEDIKPILVASDPAYANASQAYNLRLSFKPQALVYPHTSAGVGQAVKCASDNSVKVNARSGGHSYAGFGLGGEDGHLIVDLNNLKTLQLDGEIVTVGTGNHLGDVALGIWNQGQRAMAHGTCPFVGTGGHAGHGGFGLPSRNWGTVLDQITEVEAVLADGSVVTASDSENQDLYFALRGAASSFAIVTSFKAQTQAAPAHNIWFTYTWSSLDAATASKYTQIWQKFAPTLPKEYGFQIHINPQQGTTPSWVVDGYLYGDDASEAAVNETIQPLLDQLDVKPDAVQVQDQDWMEQIRFLGGVKTNEELSSANNPNYHYAFFADSIYVPTAEPLTPASSDAFHQYLWQDATAANDQVAWYLIFDLYGGDDSAISKVPMDATAAEYRDSLYSVQLWGQSPTGDLPFPDQTIPLIEGMVDAIRGAQPETHFKGYFNYVNSQLSREDAWDYYWPAHTDKLRQLKTQFDPSSTFDFPQAFTPA